MWMMTGRFVGLAVGAIWEALSGLVPGESRRGWLCEVCVCVCVAAWTGSDGLSWDNNQHKRGRAARRSYVLFSNFFSQETFRDCVCEAEIPTGIGHYGIVGSH